VILKDPAPDGTTLRGWITGRDPAAETVSFQPTDGPERTIPLAEIRRDPPETGTHLVAEGFLHVVHDVFAEGGWSWFFAAALAYTLSPLFGAIRWRMLLGVQGIRLTMGEAWRLTYIGFFFNTFMLGVTGGDVVKAYYVARRTHRKTEAVTTVFLDRLIGIFGMALLCVIALVVKWRDPALAEVQRIILLFIGGVALAALVVYSRRVRRWLFVHKVGRKLPFQRFFARLDSAVLIYRYHRAKVGLAILLSWCAHVVSIAAVYFSARALGLADASAAHFFVYMPVVWIIAALAPSVGALGVIEGLCQRYFTAGILGVETALEAVAAALAMALLFRAAMFVAVLPGGILNILHPEVSVRQAREKMEDASEAND
jgi:uncharacterized protein (TIRG00374 family)